MHCASTSKVLDFLGMEGQLTDMLGHKEKLFCRLPFTEVSINQQGNVYPACCPDWVAFPLGNVLTQEWNEIWNGQAAQAFRASMYEGSLRYCNKDWCPHISEVISGIESSVVFPVADVEHAMKCYCDSLRKDLREQKTRLSVGPVHALLNYDESCNLSCPSCRPAPKQAQGEAAALVARIHEVVQDHILKDVRSISLTGTGDPFGSRTFRTFLLGFEPRRFRQMRSIHLNTNGQLFSREMYEQMAGLHRMMLSTDISVDATTQEVYERLRWPGKWERLMENLAFIRTLKNLQCLGISMVVQYENFRQMLDFIRLGESLMYKGRYTFVEFKRIRNWGHLSEQEFRRMSMADMSPKEKAEFLSLLRAVEEKRVFNARRGRYPVIRHNLQAYLKGRSL